MKVIEFSLQIFISNIEKGSEINNFDIQIPQTPRMFPVFIFSFFLKSEELLYYMFEIN